MTDVKISDLPLADTFDDMGNVPISSEGVTKRVKGGIIADYVKDLVLSGAVDVIAGASYTVQAEDNGAVRRFDSADPVTVTVPAGLPAGFGFTPVQWGDGNVALVAGDGVTLRGRNGLMLAGKYAVAGLFAVGDDTYLLAGDTVS